MGGARRAPDEDREAATSVDEIMTMMVGWEYMVHEMIKSSFGIDLSALHWIRPFTQIVPLFTCCGWGYAYTRYQELRDRIIWRPLFLSVHAPFPPASPPKEKHTGRKKKAKEKDAGFLFVFVYLAPVAYAFFPLLIV